MVYKQLPRVRGPTLKARGIDIHCSCHIISHSNLEQQLPSIPILSTWGLQKVLNCTSPPAWALGCLLTENLLILEELLEGFAVTWGLMLPQFDRDVFDTSPDKIAKVDNLHIPDLPMLHFPQNLTQNKKYSYHVTYHVTPKSFEQFL